MVDFATFSANMAWEIIKGGFDEVMAELKGFFLWPVSFFKHKKRNQDLDDYLNKHPNQD
jgi:hypothetical protein